MNISECVDALIDLQKGDMQYLLDTLTYKTEIADILQKLLDTGGVSDEYAAQSVQQIIADTKAACLESIKPFSIFAHMHHSAYVEAIEGAVIKEQEK